MPRPALVIPADDDQSLSSRCIACSSTQPQEKGHISRLSHSTSASELVTASHPASLKSPIYLGSLCVTVAGSFQLSSGLTYLASEPQH